MTLKKKKRELNIFNFDEALTRSTLLKRLDFKGLYLARLKEFAFGKSFCIILHDMSYILATRKVWYFIRYFFGTFWFSTYRE